MGSVPTRRLLPSISCHLQPHLPSQGGTGLTPTFLTNLLLPISFCALYKICPPDGL